MIRDIARGLLAGAAGTVALNITTYGDMAVRGRAPSHVPGEVANVLLHDVGIELPNERHGHEQHEHEQQHEHEHEREHEREREAVTPGRRGPGPREHHERHERSRPRERHAHPEQHEHHEGGENREHLIQGYANPREWPHSPVARHRLTALGALMGYSVGLGMGAAYGLARPHLGVLRSPLSGVVVGLAAMAASDLPTVVTGASNPRTWGIAGWLEDLIPHLIYGVIVTRVFDTLHATAQAAERPPRRRRWPW